MDTKKSNRPPRTRWFKATMACGTERHRLYVNGNETPYFIDSAILIGHRFQGERYGLHGSGMGAEIRRRDDSTYQIALCLDIGSKILPLKMKAERLATEN